MCQNAHVQELGGAQEYYLPTGGLFPTVRAGLLRFVSAEPPEPSRNGAPGELVAVLSKTGVTVVV